MKLKQSKFTALVLYSLGSHLSGKIMKQKVYVYIEIRRHIMIMKYI